MGTDVLPIVLVTPICLLLTIYLHVHFHLTPEAVMAASAKIYYSPNWDLIGKKGNILGYLPIFTSSSPATTQSCHLVYQLFLPRKK